MHILIPRITTKKKIQGITKKPVDILDCNSNPNSKERQEERNTEIKTRWNKLKINRKVVELCPIISTIALNINRLNIPLKRQRLEDQIKKIRSSYMLNKKSL